MDQTEKGLRPLSHRISRLWEQGVQDQEYSSLSLSRGPTAGRRRKEGEAMRQQEGFLLVNYASDVISRGDATLLWTEGRH